MISLTLSAARGTKHSLNAIVDNTKQQMTNSGSVLSFSFANRDIPLRDGIGMTKITMIMSYYGLTLHAILLR